MRRQTNVFWFEFSALFRVLDRRSKKHATSP
jgi:hypothetical protein